jgi:hypothetical protein
VKSEKSCSPESSEAKAFGQKPKQKQGTPKIVTSPIFYWPRGKRRA